MKDRTPRYPGRVKLTPVAGQTNTYDMVRADSPVEPGTPINKQTLLTDETAYLLELKQECPTPDDAFSHIAKNFVGDGGMNINLLEEMINMKYCKILEAESASVNLWLAEGAAKCVCESYNGTYRYFARIVAETGVFEVRRVTKSTGVISDYSIAMSGVLSYVRNSSNSTNWTARIVPVVVRHSDHMIFMYIAGYNYSSNYKGLVGTICFDTRGNRLVSIGQTSTTSSNFPGTGVGSYNYLNTSGYQGSMLANAVRTDSGYIRFWPGYGGSSCGYIYSMQEGGTSFTSYSSYLPSSPSEYSSYPCYIALYKNDYAHSTGYSYQYHLLFSGTSATLQSSASITSMTYYSSMGSIYYSNANGGYLRSLTFSSNGLTSYFRYQYNRSPYTVYLWTNTSTVAAPTQSTVDSNPENKEQPWCLTKNESMRIVATGYTMLTDYQNRKYAQSFPFAAKAAANVYAGYVSIGTNDTPPAYNKFPCSAGFILNSSADGIIVWNEYGQVWDLKFFTQNQIPFKTWTCPEDGTYKILLVGGGAAGGDSYGGGAGYLHIATVKLLEDDYISSANGNVWEPGIYGWAETEE